MFVRGKQFQNSLLGVIGLLIKNKQHMKKYFILLMTLLTVNCAFAQWTQQNPVPKGYLLSSVYFTDANTGYAVGDSGTIIKTNDAGMTWAPLSSGTTNNLYSVQFTDANTGYVAGETILKTTDGGTTWSDLSGGTKFGKSICFPDANTGYAVGEGWNIFKTINGGSIWTDLSLFGNGRTNSVYFTDPNTGYITSDYAWQGAILKTTDGGANWNFIDFAGSDPIVPLFSVYFTNTNTGYAVGGDWAGNSAVVYKTINAGSDWTIQYQAPLHTLRSVYFADANTGYAVGDSGTILRTSNGGTDWTIQHSGTSHNLTSVFFTDANTGYAVGDSGTILKTTNGGYPLGIDEITSASNSLKIYPNPSSGKITIETSANQGKSDLSIRNINGQELLIRQITDPVTQINISTLPNGIYFMRVTGERTIQEGKFVKQF
jgi:photosystem II stability/assembly factor-like uncharacterized protein